MKSIAIYNLKGGVGKTATAVNLAFHAAADSMRTLLWDMDAQAAASWYYNAEPDRRFKASRLVKAKIPLGSLIQKTAYEGLDIIPSDLSARQLDVLLSAHGENNLRHWLSALSETYRLVIIDCPPSLSELALSVLTECDRVLVPAVPTHLSFATYRQIVALMEDKKLDVRKLYPVLTMIDRRKALHQSFTRDCPTLLGRSALGFIPYSSDVEKMGEFRRPLGDFAPRSTAAIAYRLLWENVRHHCL